MEEEKVELCLKNKSPPCGMLVNITGGGTASAMLRDETTRVIRER